MFTRQTVAEITRIAEDHGLEPAALLAVAEVESGGRVFAVIEGRKEPMIRFEGHYFDRRLSGVRREHARSAGLANPQAGAVANPASQAARWTMLNKAAAIDRKAAYESVSWGLGQVMGAHWAWLGYGSVEALVAEARSGAAGQCALMIRYIRKAGLAEALAAHDWTAFARGYNGPNYARNRYHTRMKAAYRRHAAGKAVSPGEGDTMLWRGMVGEHVRELQTALSAAGYPLRVDGSFGARTDAALRQFQHNHGLAVDGIAGPRTRAALKSALSPAARLRGWWTRLRALLARLLPQRSV